MKSLKSLFKRKIDSSSQQFNTQVQQKWSLKKNRNNSRATLIMKNESFVATTGFIRDYPMNCMLAFHLLQLREDRLQNLVKEPQLKNLDNDLFEIFESDLLAVIAAIITSQRQDNISYTQKILRNSRFV
jgi:hypothetical protein